MIGSIKFRLPEKGWFETDPATSKPITRKAPPLKHVRLWDGGAYENLGLEALYKPSRKMMECNDILVSDASGQIPSLETKRINFGLLKGNLNTPRLFDIASDQIRSLRCRMFIDAISVGKAKGALIRMGNSVRDIDLKSDRMKCASSYSQYQTDIDVSHSHLYPTNLSALSIESFDLIARHGFECSDATLAAYRPDLISGNFSWDELSQGRAGATILNSLGA